ncbi:hypothetical protein ACFL5G_04705 [Candidatus Margulisiibacteriota bacterium]
MDTSNNNPQKRALTRSIFVTDLVQATLQELNKEGKIPSRSLSLYNDVISAKTAERFIDIIEHNLDTSDVQMLKDGKLSVNKIGGYDQSGKPYLYLITLGYLCNDNVPRREKIRLLEEKLSEKETKEFLEDFCKRGMESEYLKDAFTKDHHSELEKMLKLISTVISKKKI